MEDKSFYLASGGMLVASRPVSVFTVEGGNLRWVRRYNVNCSLDALMEGGATITPFVAMTPERVDALRYALYQGWDDYNQTSEEAQPHMNELRAMLDEAQEAVTDG